MGKTARAVSVRSRRALLWGIAAFVAGQLGLLAATESFGGLRDPEHARKHDLLRARLAERPDAYPVVLLLGSSRTGTGIRPGLFPPFRTGSGTTPLVFNAGRAGHSVLGELHRLRRLLADGIRPDLVLAEVFLPWILVNEIHKFELQAEGLRSREVALLSRYHTSPGQLWLHWGKNQLPPRSLQHLGLRAHLDSLWTKEDWEAAVNWCTLDEWGWLRFEGWADGRLTPGALAATQNARAGIVPLCNTGTIDPMMDRALRELLAFCRQERIRVRLVLLPDRFHDEYSPRARAMLEAYLSRLRRETGVGVIDMHDWVPTEDYVDGGHLSHAGAARFTERFGREALAPLFLAEW